MLHFLCSSELGSNSVFCNKWNGASLLITSILSVNSPRAVLVTMSVTCRCSLTIWAWNRFLIVVFKSCCCSRNLRTSLTWFFENEASCSGLTSWAARLSSSLIKSIVALSVCFVITLFCFEFWKGYLVYLKCFINYLDFERIVPGRNMVK